MFFGIRDEFPVNSGYRVAVKLLLGPLLGALTAVESRTLV